MGSISIILRRPPYGSVEASEAIRHALGGITEDVQVQLILIDGGVNAARRNQDISDTGYLSTEEGIKDCIAMGVSVYADMFSLASEHLDADDIVEGINVMGVPEIAETIKKSDTTMIF